MNEIHEPVNTNPLLLTLAWLVVLIPTGWGLSYTIQNAMKIFTAPAPASASQTQGTSAAAPSSPAARP